MPNIATSSAPSTHRYPFRHPRQQLPAVSSARYANTSKYIKHLEANAVLNKVTGVLQEFSTSILLLTPWAKRPNSLARDLVHISLSSQLMRWQNSCNTPVTGFRTEFSSKILIYLGALAYRTLLTTGCCWRGWRNGYWWVLGALLVAIFGMRGGAAGASCWWFLFSTLEVSVYLTVLAGVE